MLLLYTVTLTLCLLLKLNDDDDDDNVRKILSSRSSLPLMAKLTHSECVFSAIAEYLSELVSFQVQAEAFRKSIDMKSEYFVFAQHYMTNCLLLVT